MSANRTDLAIGAVRAVVGITYFMHGWQKLFMMGVPGVAGYFGNIGIPAPMAAATFISVLELVGGAALLVGLFTRWVALLLAIDALTATLLVHVPKGFFAPDGIELTLLLFVGLVAVLLAGPGAYATGRLVVRRAPAAAPAIDPPTESA